MQRQVDTISDFNLGMLQLAPGEPRELRVRKKLRIVNRTRFAVSVSILMLIVVSTSMIAFASMNNNALKSNSANSSKIARIDSVEQTDTKTIEKSSKTVTLYYTVQPGDTLWSIASHINKQNYKNTRDIRQIIHIIQQVNHINDAIYAGQTLELPL